MVPAYELPTKCPSTDIALPTKFPSTHMAITYALPTNEYEQRYSRRSINVRVLMWLQLAHFLRHVLGSDIATAYALPTKSPGTDPAYLAIGSPKTADG
eukprot:3941732-Rhodomonas_salina.1